MTMSPVMVARDEGERFHFLNTLHTAKIKGEHTNGTLQAVEFLAPRNFGPPLHRHDGEDELFYILDGELWLASGDVEAVHGEGAVAWLPRGQAAHLPGPLADGSCARRHDAVGLRTVCRHPRRTDRES